MRHPIVETFAEVWYASDTVDTVISLHGIRKRSRGTVDQVGFGITVCSSQTKTRLMALFEMYIIWADVFPYSLKA